MTDPSATTDPAGAQEVVVFDVNETLLDLRALAPRFELLLPATLMGEWFSRMLRNSLVASLTGSYASFDRQGVDALLATAGSAGVRGDRGSGRRCDRGHERAAAPPGRAAGPPAPGRRRIPHGDAHELGRSGRSSPDSKCRTRPVL